MLSGLKRRWHELRAGRPGRRFQERFERMRARTRGDGSLRRWALLGLGALLVLAGVVFLPMPGPGLLIIAIGAAILAERSRAAARTLDWLEVKVRSLVGSRFL